TITASISAPPPCSIDQKAECPLFPFKKMKVNFWFAPALRKFRKELHLISFFLSLFFPFLAPSEARCRLRV
ncbi:MAG: hypothetical protein JSW66_05070, partial [Phycisphaerales bacterium]